MKTRGVAECFREFFGISGENMYLAKSQNSLTKLEGDVSREDTS